MSESDVGQWPAAYGGDGWSPRAQTLRQELGTRWAACGLVDEWSRLRAVLMHTPGIELGVADPNDAQMLEPIDVTRARRQHEALCRLYASLDIAVHAVDPPGPVSPNQMFAADLFAMTPEGAIVGRPASTVRAGEERWVARRLAALGIPILRTVRGAGTFEGADLLWLEAETAILGLGLRTNSEGARQVCAALQELGVTCITTEQPVGTMHLMGQLRLMDRDLAFAWPGRLSFRALDALRRRGYTVHFVPDELEAATRGALNVVTVGPREIVMPTGCPVTQAFFENAGVRCHTVAIDELLKAAGGIACMTGILHRQSAEPHS
jgi:N-dimethylarginine dimethylaminohydrolase